MFSALISEENDKVMDALISSLVASLNGQPDEADMQKKTREEKASSLTLHALRINEYISLYSAGNQQYIDDFQEDWNEIVECVQYLCYEFEITDEIISVSADLVLLVNPSNRQVFLRLVGRDFVKRISTISPLNVEFYLAACEMIEYCLMHRLEEDATAIAVNLAALSKDRNAEALDRHRVIVAQMLWYLVDVTTSAAIKVGSENTYSFDGISDETTARFCWLYGFALNKAEEVSAIPYYKRCAEIYFLLEGEKSWSAAKASVMYNYSLIDANQFEVAAQFLWKFLNRVDEGYYDNTDDTVDYYAAYTRYVLLTGNMEHGSLHGLLPEIENFYTYCKKSEASSEDPRLTVRVAENILSGYYLETGDYLLAAQHAENALAAVPPEGLERIPSDDVIYSNLLNIYSQLNDADKIDSIAEHLIKRLNSFAETNNFGVNRDEFYRASVLIFSGSSKLGIPPEDHLADFKKSLFDFHSRMSQHTERWRAAGKTDTGYGLYLLTCMSGVLDCFCSEHMELQCYLEIVEHLLQNPDVYNFRDMQKAMAYLMKADVLWNMDDPRAISAAQECLRYGAVLPPSQEALVSMKRFVAVIMNSFGRTDLAKPVALSTIDSITAAWQKAVSYLNDHRVNQVLFNIQFYFDICYAILKQAGDIAEQYDQILRFKNLPALVGRERNRLLQSAPIDENLKNRIFALQNRLASAQLEDAIKDDNSSERIISELQQLEAQFAAEFPQNLKFTDISVDRIFEQLDSRDVIVEYYFSYNKNALSGRPSATDNLALEIYIIFKEFGKRRIIRQINADGNKINACAAELVSYYQDQKNVGERDAASIRAFLYRCLVLPILPYVEQARRVFLAPDMALCNLPIETLYSSDGDRLSDYCQTTRLVCGRDLLFFQDSESNVQTSFVLGNPDYDIDRTYDADAERRIDKDDIAKALPFSELEALSISRLCKCVPFTGKSATKYSLQKSLPCRIIHLATHGVVDESMESDSLYSSALLFAGYNRWLLAESEAASYGNGILTADEISRMDLSQTELVVLSACQSGLGDVSFGGIQGLLSAFSAAGVKWIICHMWHADDYASAVLMEAFYRAYLVQGKTVPIALHVAKEYVRNATVKQLRDTGWLKVPYNISCQKDVKDYIDSLNRSNDRRRPFNGEVYWGGFVCYQCR